MLVCVCVCVCGRLVWCVPGGKRHECLHALRGRLAMRCRELFFGAYAVRYPRALWEAMRQEVASALEDWAATKARAVVRERWTG